MNNKLKNVVVALACILVLVLALDTAKNELANWLLDQFVTEATIVSIKK